jgi:hypothetical protein
MEQAVREARRAEQEGLSTLEWGQNVQCRAFGEEAAEGAFRNARRRLSAEQGTDEATLQEPPSPVETFAFLVAWEELGGSSLLAALREVRRQKDESLPLN